MPTIAKHSNFKSSTEDWPIFGLLSRLSEVIWLSSQARMERMLDLAFQLGEHSTPLMVGDYRGLITYIYTHTQYI